MTIDWYKEFVDISYTPANDELVSTFTPAGSQPEAIEKLIAEFTAGDQYLTLLGVTGSGKMFTMANVIAPNDMRLEHGKEYLSKRWI